MIKWGKVVFLIRDRREGKTIALSCSLDENRLRRPRARKAIDTAISPLRRGRAASPGAGALVRRRPSLRTAVAVVATAGFLCPTGPALATSTSTSAPAPASTSTSTSTGRVARGTLQAAFAEAARTYGVPESVLLGVSYLESRWEANAGLPSTSGGFGPMHLTDAAALSSALSHSPHHHTGDAEDPRGDDSRATKHPVEAGAPGIAGVLRTLERAAELTGESRRRLRGDAAANILGGAALLADQQRRLGIRPGRGPAGWYGAVAGYSGASDTGTARAFADAVYAVIRSGADRVTGDGRQVRLRAVPGLRPFEGQLERLGLREPVTGDVECPATISCEWIPAPYRALPGGGYGNHDLSDRPLNQGIDYIVIHDTETAYDPTVRLVQDPAYVSWHYTLRSQDGHVAQHLRTGDVGWHAGNWYVNATSIGLEHEGFLTQGGAWYTEAMYRASAELVRHLALRYGIPLDRAHVIGHDNVPGPLPGTVGGMHEDPGPYWDWAHYFELLGRPLQASGGPGAGSVTILPDYATNRPRYTGCDPAEPAAACPPHGSSSVWLRTEPREDAPLVRDIGKHPDGGALDDVRDHGARAATGQRYAVAGRQGDWTAIWYLGQRAWFHDPADHPVSVPSSGPVVTPRPGLESVPVYGRAYPEPEAYPAGVPVQPIIPLQYAFGAGQRYTLGLVARGAYYRAAAFDAQERPVVRGELRYYQIQFGHRVMFVRADDVTVSPD
ncbi:peptidoglycan recognition family protein [Streptosporangium sp. NPDC051023]|uniref:peptidoglycan recognition family protein n=1 Tax=Streptosporangium sp. NPDC051023 TaxID=3155410 RepID=UPI00344C5EC9